MRIKNRILLGTVLSVLCVVANTTPVSGQSIWLPHSDESTLSLEVLKSDMYTYLWGSSKPKFLTTVWFLSTRVPVSRNVHLLAELPFVHFDSEWRPGDMIGNPFLGLEVGDNQKRMYGLFGVRIPLVPDDKPGAVRYGSYSDVDRTEAFEPDLLPMSGRFGMRRTWESGAMVHGYIGPCVWLYIGDVDDVDTEVAVEYGIQLWVHSGAARMGGGFTGRLWATADDADFAEKTVHQFGFAASFGSGRVHPGFHVRVPLDDLAEYFGVKYIWGLNVTFDLGSDE